MNYTIPEGWEECAAEEATHVWSIVVRDKFEMIYLVDDVVKIYFSNSTEDEEVLSKPSLKKLGLAPIRKKPYVPIEFEIKGFYSCGRRIGVRYEGLGCAIDDEKLIGKKFREVIENE